MSGNSILFLFLAMTLSLVNTSCGGSRGGNGGAFTPLEASVTGVTLTGNSVQITGQNLGNVTGMNLRQTGTIVGLNILSKTPTGIVAELASDYLITLGLAAELDMYTPNTLVTATLTVNLNGATLVQNFESTGIDDNAAATAMTIDAAGNVGIGTATPGAQLEVRNLTGTLLRLTNNTNTTSPVAQIFYSSTQQEAWLQTLGTGEFQIGSDHGNGNGFLTFYIRDSGGSGAERMRITNAGNVGIGTTSPNIISAGTALTVNNTAGANVEIATGAAGQARLLYYLGTTQKGSLAYNDVTANMELNAAFPTNLVLMTQAVERMRITSGGDVGIGVTVPLYKLHVENTATDPAGATGASSSKHTLTTTADMLRYSYGHLSFDVLAPSVGTTLSGNQYSIYALNTTTGAGTVANAIGIYSAINKSAGTITDGKAFFAECQDAVTCYGLYINGADAEIGTSWGIYETGADKNYFSGNVGIGDTSPDTALKVVGALCVKSNDGDCAGNVAGTIYANNTTVQAADYAEYFLAEERLEKGSVVGLNPVTGLARGYRPGDQLLGIVSTSPGIVGNSDIQHQQSVLVALMGQVPFRADQVRRHGNVAKTMDGKTIGYLLASGDLYVNVGSTNQENEIASMRQESGLLKAKLGSLKSTILDAIREISATLSGHEKEIRALRDENAVLKTKFASLEERLRELEKARSPDLM